MALRGEIPLPKKVIMNDENTAEMLNRKREQNHPFTREIDLTPLEHVILGSSVKLLDDKGRPIITEDGPVNITSDTIEKLYPAYSHKLLSPEGLGMGYSLESITKARKNHPLEIGQSFTIWDPDTNLRQLLYYQQIRIGMILPDISVGDPSRITFELFDQSGRRLSEGVDRIIKSLSPNNSYSKILGNPDIFQGFISYPIKPPEIKQELSFEL